MNYRHVLTVFLGFVDCLLLQIPEACSKIGVISIINYHAVPITIILKDSEASKCINVACLLLAVNITATITKNVTSYSVTLLCI